MPATSCPASHPHVPLEPEAVKPHALGQAIASLIEQRPSAGEPLTGATDAVNILAEAAAGF